LGSRIGKTGKLDVFTLAFFDHTLRFYRPSQSSQLSITEHYFMSAVIDSITAMLLMAIRSMTSMVIAMLVLCVLMR